MVERRDDLYEEFQSPTRELCKVEASIDVRVLIADDHPLLRSGVRTALSRLPDFEVVGESACAEDTRRMALEKKPDLLILDVNMPGIPVDQVILEVRKELPKIKVLILTGSVDSDSIRRLSVAGISGCLLKDEAPECLELAVRVIGQGASWFSHSVAQLIIGFARPADTEILLLTDQERELLRRITLGHENQKIAAAMHLANQTVRNYISVIYKKLKVNTRVEAVVWAGNRQLNRV